MDALYRESSAISGTAADFARAEGVYYYNTQGGKLLDGSSGLDCIPLGHGRREIREAVTRQMEELDYAPPFQYGVPPPSNSPPRWRR